MTSLIVNDLLKAPVKLGLELFVGGNSWVHFCCLVAQLCLTLCDCMDCSTPGFPVLHYLLEFAHTHIHRVGDAIQLSHFLSPPSPPALHVSQHHGLFSEAF